MSKAGVIVIGSGIAGLMTAHLLADQFHVIILTKHSLTTSNSYLAQGGIAAAIGKDDDWSKHYEDTVTAGYDHHHEKHVEEMVRHAPRIIDSLIKLGVPFDRDLHKQIRLGKEAAHRVRRIAHVHGDGTGAAFIDCLLGQLKNRVEIMENSRVERLLVDDEQVVGVQTNNCKLYADYTVLATGGFGQLYTYTSNSISATGDGVTLAYRAGAKLIDLEFIQFHPTVIIQGGKAIGLASEALRGEGAYLINDEGKAFMNSFPQKDLEARDIVSREIEKQLAAGRKVYLDISLVNHFATRFPQIERICQRNNINTKKGIVEVAPGAHFTNGGVQTDSSARTSLSNLYAVGEVACTKVHGANRLASNSLLEALFFAEKAATDMLNRAVTGNEIGLKWINETGKMDSIKSSLFLIPSIDELRKRMFHAVGIHRESRSLVEFLNWLEVYKNWFMDEEKIDSTQREEANQYLLAYLVTSAALGRKESRGGHHRLDFPETESDWNQKTLQWGLSKNRTKLTTYI
ncbi:L-aspartate oxidase [Alkalihalobacillus pseudalcaliphilus]|uniref:L-aspartate oxidase n=1 Tax=Alkalihalobacillus pseudalcaliphilus TaxID=79884 RepID=UPI00064DCB3A|nr:L-aspartate oxidase [Alkalihalobacillus pseudalcaliphilus]KMK75707.1 hypothetical protein AB990_10525 [Alkalihalobacillus pseudalcaliphilus]